VFWKEIKECSIKEKKRPEVEKKTKTSKGKKDSGAVLAPEGMKVEDAATGKTNELMMVEVTWMQPYLAYLRNKELPENQVEARRIIRRSKAFRVVNSELYKLRILGVLQ
jgi:hypothetical protein